MVHVGSIDIKTLHYSSSLGELIFKVKEKELIQVSSSYNISLKELKDILDKELKECGMRVGVCNTAIDFLITKNNTEDENHKSIRKSIKQSILLAATYYANVVNKQEYV